MRQSGGRLPHASRNSAACFESRRAVTSGRNKQQQTNNTNKMTPPSKLLRAVASIGAAMAFAFSAGAQCNINMGANQQTMDGFGFSSAWCGQFRPLKTTRFITPWVSRSCAFALTQTETGRTRRSTRSSPRPRSQGAGHALVTACKHEGQQQCRSRLFVAQPVRAPMQPI